MATGKLPLGDAKAAHAALSALGWSHAQIERLIGRRCVRCLGLRRNAKHPELCFGCHRTERVARMHRHATCPVCKHKRKLRKPSHVGISTCSVECRRELAKMRWAGVIPSAKAAE